MRAFGAVILPLFAVAAVGAGCLDLTQSNGSGDAGSSAAATSDGGVDTAAVTGGNCGIEQNSGIQLCQAVSTCPNVVVDTQALPNCGFRVRGGVADLVCVCGTSVCPMGVFANCTEATQLLTSQTEQQVCTQVADGRCSEATATSTTSPTPTHDNPACDQQCVKDCGGGAACASVCNCD